MTTAWPARGKALGGLDAKDYVDEEDNDLAAQIATLTQGTGDMRNADNLAFLVDYAIARAFLDVDSTTQVNTKIADAIATVVIGAVSASSVSFTPNGTISATDVQTAIQEVRDEASAGGGIGDLLAANNLADLLDAATARINLGLGTAATHPATDFQPTDADLTAISLLTTTSFGRSFLELVDPAALRTLAGLGTAAVANTTAFDASGLAAQALLDAKAYADLIAAGFQPRAACRVATAAALPACTYANGTAGVGATLTATGNGALTVDGVAVAVADRILVKNQAAPAQNGIYTVTAPLGDASNPFILTRATDADASADVPAGMFTFITSGTSPRLAAGFVQLTTGPLTIGTSAQVFDQSSSSAAYTSSNGIVLTGSNFAPTYGTGANTVTQGNDSRLSDARTPLAHAVSHASGGTDALTLAQSQVTNLVSDLAAKQPVDSDLTAIAALTTSVYGRSVLTQVDAVALRTLQGLGDSATKNVGTTAGTVAAGDDSRFGAAADPELSAIAALTSAANKGIQFTGSGTAATYDLTAAGKALLDDADATAQRTTLGLAIGTNVQAWDTDLDSLAALTTTTLGRTRLTGTRSTFSNANYTVLATDIHVDQIGTLTAARTVTLPAASAVPAGWRVTISNQSRTTPPPPGTSITLTIACAGADTLFNEVDFANTTSVVVRSPLVPYEFVSNGVDTWTVVGHGMSRPLAFWQHGHDIAVPDGVWTPIPWNVLFADFNNLAPGLQTLTTTVAVGSNGATLPTGTINVASTTGFPTSGYIAITGPPGSGVDTIVGYTGKTGTTFTGCNTAGTLVPTTGISTGTLATGQVVTGANCRFTCHTPYLWQFTACAAWDANDTGVRNIRFRDAQSPYFLPVTNGNDAPALNTAAQTVSVTLQPGVALGQYSLVEVYQSSGAVLNTITNGICAPLLMMCLLAAA